MCCCGVSSCRCERRISHTVAALVVLLSVLFLSLSASVSVAVSSDPLVDEKSGVIIDWRRGAIVATGGAAADHRMPSADVARPGAERRAQASARTRLGEALRALPLGGGRRLDEAAVERALGRARATNVDYQSNGGALVRMEIGFGDWANGSQVPSPSGAGGGGGAAGEGKSVATIALLLSEGRLAAAPLLVVGGREVTIEGARYSTVAALPAGGRPLTVRADKEGRLLPEKGASLPEFAGRQVVIYVRKILR